MIIVDASVAIKWLVEEEFSVEAEALSIAAEASGESLAAPPLLPMEIANALRQRIRRADTTLDEALARFDRLQEIPIELHFPAFLSKRALTLSIQFNLPAVYDAHYIALAEHEGCDLWTADQRLLRALDGRLPFVKWIGNYRVAQPE